MAKRERPLKGDGRTGIDYKDVMAAFVTGSVRMTALDDTTVPDGNQQVTLKRFDNGVAQADTQHSVQKRRLTKLEIIEP
jgi:hypothetical protein